MLNAHMISYIVILFILLCNYMFGNGNGTSGTSLNMDVFCSDKA